MRMISLLIVLGAMTSVSGQDLASLLKSHYKAAGQEKMGKVETIIFTGTNKLTMAGAQSAFKAYQARPNNVRAEADYQGSKIIQTYNGETGWIYAPKMGIAQPKEMTTQELRVLRDIAGFENDLWNYESRGITIEMMGKSEDGTEEILRWTDQDGHIQMFYIDLETHLINMVKTIQVMGNAENEIEIHYSDYKPVKGVQMAHEMISKMNGMTLTTMQIDQIRFNQEIDPALFEKPAIE